MKSARKLSPPWFASLLLAVAGATAALAQTPIDPSATVTENESATAPINPFGISISLAMILGLMGLLVVLILIDPVHALRAPVLPGRGVHEGRSGRSGGAGSGAPSPQRRPVAGRAGRRGAPGRADVARRPRSTAAPAGRGRPGAGGRSPPRRPPQHLPPPAAASAGRRSRSSPGRRAPRRCRDRRSAPEVTLDQEAFDATLKELLDAGTDRRIAEGKARRAGMIAARKKAAGEA